MKNKTCVEDFTSFAEARRFVGNEGPGWQDVQDDLAEKDMDALVAQSEAMGKGVELDVEKMRELLAVIWLDCQNALSDDWDRSDEGFIAMADNIEEVLS